MGQSKSTQTNSNKPAKKRPTWARILMWGFMLLLLVATVAEWRARSGYDGTLAAINQRLQGQQKLPVSDLKQYVQGYAVRDEELDGNRRVITLQWPSLFKTHKLRLGVADPNVIYFAEPYELDDSPRRSSLTTPIVRSGLQNGLPAGYENVVAVTTTDLLKDDELSSGLSRELIRESVLIAAQEELGLSTLDPSIGETILESPTPGSFAFTLMIPAPPRDPDAGASVQKQVASKFNIQVSRPTVAGKPFVWTSPDIALPEESRIESLAQQMAAMSRGPFVDMLKSAGFTKSNDQQPAAPAGQADEDHLDFVNQYARLRRLHGQIHAQGETPEAVAGVVRAYANLGNLTDYHWAPTSKAFKARALIYAERLIAKSGETPFTLAHRAYALALTGRHGTALKAIQAAMSAKGNAAPDWLPLITSYCEFKPEQLENASEPHLELARYLQLRLIDFRDDARHEQGLKDVLRFLSLNGACFRAAQLMGETNALGAERELAESAYGGLWPKTYARLRELPGLPPAALRLAESGSTPNEQRPDLEFTIRAKLMDELKQAAATEKYSRGLSWAVLETLLRDVSFVQACQAVVLQEQKLGRSADHLLVILKPLYDGHRYAKFLETFVGPQQQSLQRLQEFLQTIDLALCDAPMMPIVLSTVHRTDGGTQQSTVVAKAIYLHMDYIYEDILVAEGMRIPPARLMEASPGAPRFIAASINTPAFNEQAKALEEKYADSPVILTAIAQRYLFDNRHGDAIRCLKKAVAITPSRSTYEMLAFIYQQDDDFENWCDALEHAVKQPSFGLESARLQEELAKAFMNRGEWKKAQSYAREAAATGSAWGMSTAARCAEGLGDWKQAEAFVRSVSSRYESNSIEWYFWCVRTGRGDLETAKQVAEPYWIALTPPLSEAQTRQLAAKQILDGHPEEAQATFAEALKQKDYLAGIYAAILADDRKDKATRDSLLKVVERDLWNSECVTEFVNLIYGQLGGKEQGAWNPKDFERCVTDPKCHDEIPYLYYFASIFLKNNGQLELADEYLQCAATTFDVELRACALANDALRKQNKKVGATRLNNVSDSIAPASAIVEKAINARYNRADPNRALKFLDNAVQINPNFIPARLRRGELLEEAARYSAAISDYEEAIRVDPRCFAAHASLAWLLATCDEENIRNGEKALSHAKLAANIRFFKSSRSLRTLAAAQAELGHFKEAIDLEEQSDGANEFNSSNHNEASLYRANKPYHRKPPKPAKVP